MSVYTEVTFKSLQNKLINYNCGELCDLQPILSGTTNSNYKVSTTKDEYVLTLFEQLKKDELIHYLNLVSHLYNCGLPVAPAIKDNDGVEIIILSGKPAIIQPFLPGAAPETPSLAQIDFFSKTVAELHIALKDFKPKIENTFSTYWYNKSVDFLSTKMPAQLSSLLLDEWRYIQQQKNNFDSLPKGMVHADLFRDNTLFVGEKLTAIIDFYYACNESWLFDLSIAVTDWCFDEGFNFSVDKFKALMNGYQSKRRLHDDELRNFYSMLRMSAFRFWLSRANIEFSIEHKENVYIKPSYEYEKKLCFYRESEKLITCLVQG